MWTISGQSLSRRSEVDEDGGGLSRRWYFGVERTGLYGELVATTYNLVRMSRLIAGEETRAPIVA